MTLKPLCVPKGIYLRLGAFTDGLYNLLVWGWTDPGEGVVIHELCRRCKRSLKSIRRNITEGKRLGWIKSSRDFDGVVRYTRHAPGPYVDVVCPESLRGNRVAQRLYILCQLNSNFCYVDFCIRHLHYSKSSIYAALKHLSDLSLYCGETSALTKDILNASLRSSTRPKPKPRVGRQELERVYGDWVSGGQASLDCRDVNYVSQVLCQHFKVLCLRVEQLNCNVTSSKVADMANVLSWVSVSPDVYVDADDAKRLRDITGPNPYDTVLFAIESLFTKYFSGFTYDFNVLFKITDTKNNFDRFVLSSYLKARKNPNWRDPILRKTKVIPPNQSESYNDYKKRLLSSKNKLGSDNS